MMQIALRARLKACAPLAALVNSIEWISRPQASAVPALVLTQIASGRAYTMGGASGLQGTGVRIDGWATSYAATRGIVAALVDELERPRVTVSGVRFECAFLDSDRDLPVEAVDGLPLLYRLNCDFSVWWKQL